MRHRRVGRKLGRNPNHQRALLKNLVIALVLTERDAEGEENKPKQPGRIVTTLTKAKEVRPLVERCVTLAKRAQVHLNAAAALATTAPRGSSQWKQWRTSDQWKEWNKTIAPAVALRRRVLAMIGSKEAVSILFNTIAPRFVKRAGGYTRIMRLAKPRLGDASIRAILEFVGVNDRRRAKVAKPLVED